MIFAHAMKNAGLGALIGLTVGTSQELLISATTAATYTPGVPSFLAQFENPHTGALIARLVYAVTGAVLGLASATFDVERLGLAAAQGLHFLVTMSTLVVAGSVLHWVALGSGLFRFLGIAAAIYFVIWLFLGMSLRAQVRRTNEALAGGR